MSPRRPAALPLLLALLAAGIAATPFSTSIPLLVVNAVLIGVGFGMVTPLGQAIVFDGSTADNRSIAMGVRMTGNRLAQMASPLVFGFVIVLTVMFMPTGIGGLIDRYLVTRGFIAIRKAKSDAA